MRVHAAVLVTVLATHACTRQEDASPLEHLPSPERSAELRQAIPALMDSAGVPGLAIAVVADSGIAWSAGFGMRSADSGGAVDEHTVFEAASLSKPVFAYAVLQLVDSGLIDLDTPLAEYFDYRDIAHDDRHRRITPRMVLTHSTGFPNWRPRRGQGGGAGRGQLTINFEPGERFSYSGEGFGYLQQAAMHITGQPLQDLVNRLVFEPLLMTRSSYVWDERLEDNLALPHGADGEVLRKSKPARGRGHAAATLHTTATDYARFIAAAMNGELLSDTMASAMLTPQIEVDSGVTWGLGIGLQQSASDGRAAFWHWGDNSGYKAYTLTDPNARVGVVWFTNSENGQGILESMLSHAVGGDQPGARWLDYEQYDSPERQVQQELARTLEEQGIDAAITRYRELKSGGPAEAFDEDLLNTAGYMLLRGGRVEEAIAVFELNVAEYPDAWNPYDSLGEAYLVAGDTARAVEYYERSLELNPENDNGRAVLERIRRE
jgi:CubicO group peptidase (beta-lactamase class C family)